MNDFLDFLNTADADTLTRIPGINHSLAENLIAARPFDFVEDCLKVRGMGKNLLAHAQSDFERLKLEEGNSALIPVEQEVMPIQRDQFMEETTSESKPSFGSRLGQAFRDFLRAVLKLILFVMLIAGVGAAIYYGAPLLNNRFIAPVEQNAERVSELESQVADLQTQITEMKNQLTEINSHIEGVEQSVEAHTVSIEKLEAMQITLEKQIKENNDESLLALKNEVMLTRIIDILARARLYLAQSNFGLAKEDVQSAHDLLVELQADSDDEALAQATQRLELTLGNLPGFPVVASGDLEIAWQILVTGEAITITATPEPASTHTPTSVPTLEPTLTPTVTP